MSPVLIIIIIILKNFKSKYGILDNIYLIYIQDSFSDTRALFLWGIITLCYFLWVKAHK